MIRFDVNRFFAELPPWLRAPLGFVLLLAIGLAIAIVLATFWAMIEGRGVTLSWTRVEIAPRATACTEYAKLSANTRGASQDIVENLREQIAEFSKQANGTGPNAFAAQVKVTELLMKQDDIARWRNEELQRLRTACQKLSS